MELISKREMMHREWRTFERYPEQGADVVLHVKGYRIRENKYVHDFIRLLKFNGKTFNPKAFTPIDKNTVWTYLWLPTSKVTL